MRRRFGQDVAGHVEVAVEQLQQQGEVVGIALVRRGRQEEEVVGMIPEELAQLVPLGLVDLAAVLVGGHLVGFVHDHQVPMHVPHQVEDVVLPSQEVDGRDALRVIFPDVLAVGGADGGPVDHGEGLAELVVEFTPPLVGEVGGRDDERPLDQGPGT